MDGLLLVGVLLAQQLSGVPPTPVRIDADVAFDGHVYANAPTELRVRSFSPAGGRLRLQTIGSSPQVEANLELPRGVTVETSLPLGIDLSDPAPVLKAQLDQAAPQSIALNIVRYSKPWSALVGSVTTEWLSQLPSTEAVRGESLPRLAPAYRQLAAMAIDSRALAALDDAQLRALLDHVGVCGRLMLIGIAASVERVFANKAACDGRFLKVAHDAGRAGIAFAELVELPETAPASTEQVGRLLRESQGPAHDLTVPLLFWIGYLVILGLLVLQARTRVAALGFSVVGTLLVVLIWPGAIKSAYVAWAEASSSDRVARYVGLERHTTSRRGSFTLPGSSFGTTPETIAGDDFALQLSTNDEPMQLVWQPSPFQHIDKLTQGSFAIDSLLRVSITDDRPGVCNGGVDFSTPAFLQWQGSVFAIPALQPGTMWSSVDQATLDAKALRAPELQLFRDRSAGHATTILQSLPIAIDDKNSRAWLMRYDSDQPGELPCGN